MLTAIQKTRLEKLQPSNIVLGSRWSSIMVLKIGNRFTVLILFTICFSLFNNQLAAAQEPLKGANGQTEISGILRDSPSHQVLSGATLRIGNLMVKSDKEGKFFLTGPFKEDRLVISHLGYRDTILSISSINQFIEILMLPIDNQIEAVEVISTGYQTIAKEGATGSFSQINRQMLDSRVSTGFVDKLDGMASGLVTNLKGKQRGQADIEVRGKSTLYSNAEPLIVLDGFPYEGNLNSINPNDIENVTILKDAAAASIWGVRASNGVIVITSKKGDKKGRPVIDFDLNQSFSAKRNIFDRPMLSSSEFIEIERFLFDKGKYNAILNRGYSPVSPVVEILSQLREGRITKQESDNELTRLSNIDVRNEFDRYFNQGRHERQYSISAMGGTDRHNYYISAGLDKNQTHSIGSQVERWTLQAANTLRFLDNKVNFTHRILFSNLADISDRTGLPTEPKYPYSEYKDKDGNYLPEASSLRLSYINALTDDRLLDWYYRPLGNLYDSDYHAKRTTTSLRNSFQLEANLYRGLKASASYLHEVIRLDNPTYYGLDNYYTRDLINKFSYLDTSGELAYHVPLGAVLDVTNRMSTDQTARFQFSYDGAFLDDHQINAIIGTEVRESKAASSRYGLYGYNKDYETHQNNLIDYTAAYPVWYSGQTERLGTRTGRSSSIDRFVSYYSNFLYSFKDRYRLSFSLRRDGSNLFGVDANQKFVPLWSIGGQWDLYKEDFFHKDLFSRFQIRFSYGYNGNINRSVSGYLTARASNSVGTFLQPYYEIVNPPNPSLQWERVRNVNLGIEFGLLQDRLTLNAEFWEKQGLNLISDKPTPTQTGISGFTGNSASTLSSGVDLSLNTINLNGRVNWTSQLFMSVSKNRVTEFFGITANNYNILSQIHDYPLVDYPQFALFSFPMKGLDNTGAPIGYLDGAESTDYRGIINSLDLQQINFVGSSVPTSNLTLWNRLQFGSFEFSVSIRWFGGYYFRRKSLDNGDLYNNINYIWDYEKRWQKPGDEHITMVPSLVYPSNINRNHFYQYSSVLVNRGDHLRLQDLQLTFHADKLLSKISIPSGKVTLSATDLGILWTRNKEHVDPLYSEGLRIKPTFSLGVHLKL